MVVVVKFQLTVIIHDFLAKSGRIVALSVDIKSIYLSQPINGLYFELFFMYNYTEKIEY